MSAGFAAFNGAYIKVAEDNEIEEGIHLDTFSLIPGYKDEAAWRMTICSFLSLGSTYSIIAYLSKNATDCSEFVARKI